MCYLYIKMYQNGGRAAPGAGEVYSASKNSGWIRGGKREREGTRRDLKGAEGREEG